MSVLAKNIRLIRKELLCTQSVMAEILKIGFRTYVRYEAGERDAPVSVLIKLARLGNISLEQFLTKSINSHDVLSAPKVSKIKTFPEIKLVDFRKGEVVFEKPARRELITIDSSEKRLLTLFRKMNIDLKKMCVRNIQETAKADTPPPPLQSLTVEAVKRRLGFNALEVYRRNNLVKDKVYLGRKKINKKLLKEKINSLKMTTKAVDRITVK